MIEWLTDKNIRKIDEAVSLLRDIIAVANSYPDPEDEEENRIYAVIDDACYNLQQVL